MTETLRIGRIDYLNVWPLFRGLTRRFPDGRGVRYTPGHPSDLNRLLHQGDLDLSPSSSFEYLAHAERYRLLPGLSISADGPVLSVHLVSPWPLQELPDRLAETGMPVALTSASASSTALLRILWRYAWRFPEPDWQIIAPGQGRGAEYPYLEIGDLALKNHLSPPPGRHVIDLAAEWRRFTGLPFVFAVWIVGRNLTPVRQRTLARVHAALMEIKAGLPGELPSLATGNELPDWLTPQGFSDYFAAVRYDLGPREKAGLLLYGDYCRRLGLMDGVPALSWQTV